MIHVRKAAERGGFDHGWLDTRHTFSFADYRDPRHMGFRSLRVLNEDRVRPGQGFPMHAHRDMEIVTLVLSGALEHEDSLGNRALLRPGEIQRMSAGTGVVHSERNPSDREPAHFLQIWILPGEKGRQPGYDQRAYPSRPLALLASPDGRDGSVTIGQDVDLHLARPAAGHPVVLDLRAGRHAWIQAVRGAASINDVPLTEGDGAAVAGERRLKLSGDAEALLFDLA
ncbi:MAG TPA: pirin family protein [Planctomycetota bacterium]